MADPVIGLFGGSFNPIHFGHINLAIAIKESCLLNEIWIIPTHQSPFRMQENIVEGYHRYKMAQLATEQIPGFKVLDIEIKRPAPSYTIDTIEQLMQLHPQQRFALLMSDGTYLDLDKWHRHEEIKRKTTILVGSRSSKNSHIKTPIMDITATGVRKRLARKAYCGHLVPAKVLDYISKHQLYSSE